MIIVKEDVWKILIYHLSLEKNEETSATKELLRVATLQSVYLGELSKKNYQILDIIQTAAQPNLLSKKVMDMF